jgi:hypothetical protein
MARINRQKAYKQADTGLTAMMLLTYGAVQQLRAGQRLHPSRQAAYAKRAKRMLLEVALQAEEVLKSMRPVAEFAPYEQRAPKKAKR